MTSRASIFVIALCIGITSCVHTYCTQLVIPAADWVLPESNIFSLTDIFFTNNNDVVFPLFEQEDVSHNGTMPWTFSQFSESDGTRFLFEVTDPDLIAGQYLTIQASLTGSQHKTEDITTSIYILVNNSLSTFIRSAPQSTIQFPIQDQWQINTFLHVPHTLDLDGAQIRIVGNTDLTTFGGNVKYVDGDVQILRSGASLRISSHPLDLGTDIPNATLSCFYYGSTQIRVNPNVLAPIEMVAGFTPSQDCQLSEFFDVQVTTTSAGAFFVEVTTLVDNITQYLAIDSTIYGRQTATTAQYISHVVRATKTRGEITFKTLEGNQGVVQFHNNEMRRVTSSLIVPPDELAINGTTMSITLAAASKSGRDDIFLVSGDKDNADSGFGFRITSFQF